MLRQIWARITFCPCRHYYYLDHVSRLEHIRNDKPARRP